MTQAADQTVRDGSGRFVPGQSGNPKGKAPGTRNRATVLRELLRDGDEAAIGRMLIDRALGGDAVVGRFLFDRLNPKPRQRTITLDLPEGADAAAIFTAAAEAMVVGEISPEEATSVVRFLDEGLRMVQSARDIQRANAAHRAVAAVRNATAAASAAPAARSGAVPAAPPAASPAPPEPPVSVPQPAAPTRRRAASRARHQAMALHSTCKSRISEARPARRPSGTSRAKNPPSQPFPSRGEGSHHCVCCSDRTPSPLEGEGWAGG
jgi:hypothetical protein